MNSLVFFVGAACLYAAGGFCLRHTNPYSNAGGDGYLRRDRRRNLGRMLLIAATFCLAIGGIIHYVHSSH